MHVNAPLPKDPAKVPSAKPQLPPGPRLNPLSFLLFGPPQDILGFYTEVARDLGVECAYRLPKTAVAAGWDALGQGKHMSGAVVKVLKHGRETTADGVAFRADILTEQRTPNDVEGKTLHR